MFDIVGWNFRNADNTGENDGSVNAPQEIREFNFVLTRKDYETERNAWRCLMWGLDCPIGTEPDKPGEIPMSRGILTITDLQLGNLIPHDEAWIETMSFEVKIYLPAP